MTFLNNIGLVKSRVSKIILIGRVLAVFESTDTFLHNLLVLSRG